MPIIKATITCECGATVSEEIFEPRDELRIRDRFNVRFVEPIPGVKLRELQPHRCDHWTEPIELTIEEGENV